MDDVHMLKWGKTYCEKNQKQKSNNCKYAKCK